MLIGLKPLYDNVIVELVENEKTTESGIIFIEEDQEFRIGKVKAIGEGRLTVNGDIIPLKVKVGDIVLIGKYAGIDIDDNERSIKENDILAIIDNL